MLQKILIVTDRLDTIGGTEMYLQRLFSGLAGRGIQAWCLSGGGPRAEPYRHLIDTRLHDDHLLHAAPSLIRDVESLLRWENFDAVCVNNIACPALLQALARHPRSICHVHDHRYTCPTGLRVFSRSRGVCARRAGLACFGHCGLTTWLDKGVVPRWTVEFAGFRSLGHQVRQFARVLVASRYMRDTLVESGVDSRRIAVLPNVLMGRDERPSPLPQGPLRIVFVGRVEPAKGADVFVRGLVRLHDVAGVIVGDGSALPEVRRLATALGVSARIEFTGALPNDEAVSQMRAGHLVVVPSCWPEPFGIVGIEAMGAARAVIGSDAGGIPDWLIHEQTGLLVPPGDPAALAGGIERLLSDLPQLERMGQQAWQAAGSYLLDDHLDRFIELGVGE